MLLANDIWLALVLDVRINKTNAIILTLLFLG